MNTSNIGEMSITKARLAVAMKDFNIAQKRLAELSQQLEDQCEETFGHDFGPDNESSFCANCDTLNTTLTDRAELAYDEYLDSRFN